MNGYVSIRSLVYAYYRLVRAPPANDATRSQTVRKDQNPRYGVLVVRDTSSNDHGGPIMNTLAEALKDFFSVGLDVLAIEDLLIVK